MKTFCATWDVPVNTVVENRISATRTPAPHSPDTLVYEIIGEYPAQSFFGVDRLTGQISVIQDLRLDGLKTTQYKILILTYGTDKPDLRSTATVTIDVQRNLNGPRFFPQSDSIELPETTSTDFWSMPQNVTDQDSSKITCSIIGDTKSVEYFQVDPNTCVLSLKKSLKDDPDLTTTYNVLIEAVDNEQSPLTNKKTITITVFRDASPPSFQNLPATITISETRTVGDSVYAASATENWRGKIQYEIVGVYPAPSFFDVDKYSGVIRIIRDLKEDRIATEIYTLLIAVYDTKNHNSKATSEVIINVKRKPATFEFSQTIYVVQLPEITPVGSRILQVFPANASDSAIYAIETSFPLSGVNIFNMDAFNGIITTRMSLHSGTNYFYQLEVKATDKSNPLRTGVTTVFVIVEDFCCLSNNRTCELNSNAPIFSAPLYFVNVMEGDYSTNNLPLIEVSASDNDFGPDGNLVFEIQSVSNNGDGKFQIQQKPSEKKATLICIGKISRDLTYVIVVRVSDQAIHVSRKRSSSVPVEIKVVPFRK
ncbi:protocadherin Fat 3-like [Crassostrea angulata]|uniref:protocadherin Fat 3-like n=1 Tax=Magallana angulata TaxID=2784310 RepID=UPI0022B19104|nr:protocadherin Fat 3-like [Crassostrea angulata]